MGAGSQRWRLGLCLGFLVVSPTSCTVYDSSLLVVSEDTSRDSEHSGVSPDGGSGRSLSPVIGTTSGEADGGVTLQEDSTDAVLVTIDGAIVETDPDSG